MKESENLTNIVIIGGVAGGASAAARLRRLDENAKITIIERGPDVSFANCGLPYHIGGEISDRSVLAVQTPQSLKALFNLDVWVNTEATEVDRVQKQLRVKNVLDGSESYLKYDKLVLTPGASPLIPPIPGIDGESIYTLRNLQDMDAILKKASNAESALVIGAGFIGLEMAEQLNNIGLKTSLVELQDQCLPQLDPEMAAPLENSLSKNGISVHLANGVIDFQTKEGIVLSTLKDGSTISSDLVILSIGVRPENKLAKEANLELGERGHIRVNEYMQTSDPDIYAAGDVVESFCAITGKPSNVPLGGPANRQGRLIADHICQPETTKGYPGSIGTAIVRAFDTTAGITGLSEKRLKEWDIPYEKMIVNGFHHANYYPGATALSLKVLYCNTTGKIFGAQAVGENGVDKRLDVIATAIRGGMKIEELEHLELSYAPPFGSAKDLLNIAAFQAQNEKDNLVENIYEWPNEKTTQLVDVRPLPMQKEQPIPNVISIPLSELRNRMDELNPEKPVVTVCRFGKFSYFAARILKQKGFDVKSLTGGVYIR